MFKRIVPIDYTVRLNKWDETTDVMVNAKILNIEKKKLLLIAAKPFRSTVAVL